MAQFWQWESFDHLVRNAASLAKCREYIMRNPLKARLRAGEYVQFSKSRVVQLRRNWTYENPKRPVTA